MGVALVVIVILIILSIIWLVILYRKDLRKNERIFDEYLKRRRKVKAAGKRSEMRVRKKGANISP